MRLRWLGTWLCAALVCPLLGGCGYNSLQQQDEAVKTTWSEVVSQYQRRADLISSLAGSVKGFAESENGLLGTTEANARTSAQPAAPAVLTDPAAFARYQAMQDQLTRSLGSLMGMGATYPQLQSDANFLDLRAQLDEAEGRIADARTRYMDAVRTFNTTVRTFPTDLTARVFDFRPKPPLAAASN